MSNIYICDSVDEIDCLHVTWLLVTNRMKPLMWSIYTAVYVKQILGVHFRVFSRKQQCHGPAVVKDASSSKRVRSSRRLANNANFDYPGSGPRWEARILIKSDLHLLY